MSVKLLKTGPDCSQAKGLKVNRRSNISCIHLLFTGFALCTLRLFKNRRQNNMQKTSLQSSKLKLKFSLNEL